MFLGSQKSLLTRGQTLLMKSTSVNFPVSQSRIDPVQFSQKFNIPLITTTELKKVLQAKVVNHKKKSGNDPGLMMLETSFIKVEDFSQSFLPIFKKFLNFCIKSKEISNTSSKKVLKKNVNKEKFGYCECCDEYFNNLSLHRKTRRHMSFVTNVNFSSVDILIRGLPCLEDFCVLSDEGSTNSKVDKIELEENYRSSICNSCLDQNKLEASENFNKTNLAFTQQPSIINTNHYCQINKEVTNKVCTMAKENYGKFFSFQDTQCTTNDDISHSSRTADTKPGIRCLSLANVQSRMQFKQMLVRQPHHCLILGAQFENCNKASCQQDSTALYTCRPLIQQNTICYDDQDLKFIITKVTSDVDAVTNSDNKSLKTIPIQEICQNSICDESHRCPSFSAKPYSRQCGEPSKLIFSNVCNELLQALPQKNADNSMMHATSRKWIKAKRKCTKKTLSNNRHKKKLQTVPVNSSHGCSLSKFEIPRNVEETLCNLSTNSDNEQHDKLDANHGMNMWSLKYTTDLKVIFKKISSL